ncbi:MAG: 4'-phosphopantetheinyl transferase superfamily protein [Nitrospira sp.]
MLPDLIRGVLHIWTFELERSVDLSNRLERYLSIAERARAERFRFGIDRQRFIVAHGFMREILAAYLRETPASISIETSKTGKPRLAGRSAGTLAFNLAHSHGRGVVAVGLSGEVGVDIERLREDVPVQSLADRFFSQAERIDLRRCEDHARYVRFFRYWVAKEAYLKFVGTGLAFPLDRCQVVLAADGATAEIEWEGGPTERERGHVKYLSLPEGWVGAVSAQGTDWSVQLDEWPSS